ncbi:hypothetical protein HAX54_044496, partial [Datura stramonium]|nr:hypothetical protein [Datura stramonium]
MSSKRKEVVVADPNVNRERKGIKGASSLASKVGPARRFGAKAAEPHGFTWFNTQKEAKYEPENWIDEGLLALEFPTIQYKICELGVGYIFNESERCNLTLAMNYENWDTSLTKSTK